MSNFRITYLEATITCAAAGCDRTCAVAVKVADNPTCLDDLEADAIQAAAKKGWSGDGWCPRCEDDYQREAAAERDAKIEREMA